MKESELKTAGHNCPIQKSELKTKKQDWLMKESKLKMDRHNRLIQKSEQSPDTKIGTIARYKNHNLT
jgi:hypothetical protein